MLIPIVSGVRLYILYHLWNNEDRHADEANGGLQGHRCEALS